MVNAAGDTIVYSYDGNGNLVQKTDEDGYVTEYAYNGVDLVTNISYNGGKEAGFAYNAAGELVKMTDWTGETTFEVDLLKRLTSVNDHNGRIVSYEYDEVSNQTAVHYPDGTMAGYEYDLIHNMMKVTENDGRETAYEYDAMSRLTKVEYPNGWADEYSYDAMGRVFEHVKTDPTATVSKTIAARYTYDPEGNLLAYYKDGNGIGEVREDYTYAYDALNRLTEAHGLYGKTDHYYTYDSLGNLTFEKTDNNKSVDYKYNKLNQLTSKIVDGKDTYSYTYDKRGNNIKQVYEKFKSIEAIYEYDETNRMVRGINAYAEVSEYTYNGLGYLVQNDWTTAKEAYGYHGFTEVTPANVPKNTTHNPPNKWQLIDKSYVIDYTSGIHNYLMKYESGSPDSLSYRYVYANEAKLSVNVSPVTQAAGDLIENGEIRLYYHNDRLGSARYLSSGKTGKIASWTAYDEWGQITHNTVVKCGVRELDMVQQYTNHDFDAVLSVYYAKARLYDPQDKRFLAVDIIKGTITLPMSLTQYIYVLDNPIKYVDPYGLVAVDILEYAKAMGGTIEHYTKDEKAHVKITYNGVTQGYTNYNSGKIDDSVLNAKFGWEYSWIRNGDNEAIYLGVDKAFEPFGRLFDSYHASVIIFVSSDSSYYGTENFIDYNGNVQYVTMGGESGAAIHQVRGE